ncbi:ITA10 protein, partial [Dicaeum eximium]|nr:ITA10 protein [Dicaeum eximium]
CPSRLLVAAPWDEQGQGAIYKCAVGPRNSSCAKATLGTGGCWRCPGCPWLSPPAHPALSPCPQGHTAPWLRASAGHLGMTLVATEDGGFVACAPLWSQECGTSIFSSGRCLRLDQQLQPVATIAPTAQREWGGTGRAGGEQEVSPRCHRCHHPPPAGCATFMDIVLVLDGSNSIYPWEEVQAFLGNILARFFIGPAQTQVAVLQYGERLVQEWALGQHPTAQSLLRAARNLTRQEGRETRTAMAIRRAWWAGGDGGDLGGAG